MATFKTPKAKPIQVLRFAGVSLGGGKTNKTSVAILEYYPQQKRLFLRSLRERVKAEEGQSPDVRLHDILTEEEAPLDRVAFDVPLQFPKCLRCELACPGVEKCKQPEIKWMWDFYKRKLAKKGGKLFTPYTERCVEMYIRSELEEAFYPSHALGSNAAPLTARAYFITRRLNVPVVETFPKLTLWRIGQALRIPKSYLRFHRHSVDSDEARHYVLKTIVEKEIAFLYQQDVKTMVEDPHAFDAFLCAVTAYLQFKGQTERAPTGFPKGEVWLAFPKNDFQWF